MVKNSYKKIITMYGASFLAIVVGFLISIFNSRILGPESFGDYKFIETVARFISSLVSVGVFISITRLLALNTDQNKERRYIGLFTVILGITSLIGILLFFGFSFIQPYYFDNNLQDIIQKYFFIVPVILGHLALAEILKGLHRIYTISFISVVPALCYLMSIYAINTFIPVDVGWVLLVYYGMLLITLIVIIIRLKPDFGFKKPLVKELLQENKNNGRPIYYGSLAGVATTHIAGLSLSYFMDNTQVGFFTLALTICSPLLVIPSVLGTIYFKQFATIEKIPKKVFYFSILGTVIALFVFYSFIELAVVNFYKEDYLPVVDISKLLIVGFIFHGIGDIFNRFLGAKGKGKLLRNAAYLVGIINIFGYTLFIKYFNIDGAILTKILASGLYFLLMWRYYHNFVKKEK